MFCSVSTGTVPIRCWSRLSVAASYMSFIYPRAMFFVVIYLFVYCALTWNAVENTGTCQKKK